MCIRFYVFALLEYVYNDQNETKQIFEMRSYTDTGAATKAGTHTHVSTLSLLSASKKQYINPIID